MVKDIVKQAIQIKLTCHSESPLLSPAEFAHAAGLAIKLTKVCPGEELLDCHTVAEMKERLLPKLKKVTEQYQEDEKSDRLLRLLLTCKAEGEVTEEISDLLKMGLE